MPEDIIGAAKGYNISLDGITVVDAYEEEGLAQLITEYTEKYPLNSAKTMKRK